MISAGGTNSGSKCLSPGFKGGDSLNRTGVLMLRPLRSGEFPGEGDPSHFQGGVGCIQSSVEKARLKQVMSLNWFAIGRRASSRGHNKKWASQECIVLVKMSCTTLEKTCANTKHPKYVLVAIEVQEHSTFFQNNQKDCFFKIRGGFVHEQCFCSCANTKHPKYVLVAIEVQEHSIFFQNNQKKDFCFQNTRRICARTCFCSNRLQAPFFTLEV